MFQTVPLVTLTCDCQKAVTQATRCLEEAGLQVLQSFNLQSAMPADIPCTCPHHGTDQCTCQFVVMLIYGQVGQFVTLIAHGYEAQTYLSLVDSPQQPMNGRLANVIRNKLTADQFLGILADQINAEPDLP